MPRAKSTKSNVKGVSFRNDTQKWIYRTRGYNKIYREFSSKAEAETFAYQMNVNNCLGVKISANKELLLSDALEKYISQSPEANLCKSHTIKDYRANAKNHITPYFRGRTAISISKNDIEDFKHYLSQKTKINSPKNNPKKLSARTINEILRLLNATFEHLVDGEYIVENPMLRVKKIPNHSKSREILTLAEALKLLNIAKNKISVTPKGVIQGEYYLLILFSLITGARAGEIFALTWDDINFDECLVQLNKSYSHKKIGTTKTATSNRIIQIPIFLCQKLYQHKNLQAENPLNLVFPNRVGNYQDSSNLNNRVLKKFIKEAQINKHIVWHSLRHSSATILTELGVKANALQTQLGHSDIKTTLGIYSHTTQAMLEQMMQALEVFNIDHKQKERAE